MWLEWTKRARNATALRDDGGRSRSFAELADRATRVARLLRGELGLSPGDRAAVLMANRAEFVELTLGALLAGVWLTPMNRHLARSELAYVLDDSGARVLFSDDVHRELAAGLARESSQPQGGAAPTLLLAGESLDAALASASDAPMPLEGPAGGTMIYTSGTTGRPKGVQRTRPSTLGDALEAVAAAGRALGLDGSGPHLVPGPLYHAAPLLFAIYDQSNGACIDIMEHFDERETLRALERRAIHHTHLVPTLFVRLLRLPESERAAFSASELHLVLHGAAPISPVTKRRMIAWWGEVLVEYWGATESGVCTLIDSPDWLAHPGSVGRALPSFEVFAVDDAGARLPANAPGVLYCRRRDGAPAFEYHADPEKTRKAHLEPGVFTIGDIARVDAEGYVYLLDRKSNMIISGGVNIYPVEIEQVLQEHAAVADVGVFGVPDEEWGERVVAAVELRPGWSGSESLAREIIAFGRIRLAGFKVPREIDFEERLPRHPTGKLLVRQLRERRLLRSAG